MGFPPPSRAAALQSGRTVEAEVITVTADGFEPAEITRPAGRFLLVVENRSGVESITFHISDEAGELLKQVALPAEKPDWAEELDLPAGRYRLAEAGHPDWSCLITVTE
ncbi:MAG TPA: hypothetical protein VG148_12785 [Pyrinomonadaceae bacterium]|nr:hypothetical protein [Pyrinomonadaceae bacterium]